MKFVETIGKTREEAIEKAADELGVSVDDISVEILEEGNKGLFGLIGAKDYKIKATIRESLEVDFSPKDILMGLDEEKNKSDKKTDKKAEINKEKIVPKSSNQISKSSPSKEVKSENKIVRSPVKQDSNVGQSLLSENELKESIQGFLSEIFRALDIQGQIDVHKEEEIAKVKIIGESAGILIGRRGESLDALQLLLGLAVNKKAEGYVRVQLDIENYREKREESLIRYAHKMARTASKQRRNIRLEPMNPNERRIVHSALQSDTYVTTYSEGEEPYRKVVIAVKGR